jgi:hypothetical protein
MTMSARVNAAMKATIVLIAIVSSSVFYVLLLRSYGALPIAKANQQAIVENTATIRELCFQVDSLETVIRRMDKRSAYWRLK